MAYQMNEIAGINSILSSKISPPIYVDSRKTASDLSLKVQQQKN